MASPARLEDVNPADYDAVYVSGGHGLMEDLADNPVIGRIFAALYPDKSKAVAAVCHGVGALLPAREAELAKEIESRAGRCDAHGSVIWPAAG